VYQFLNSSIILAFIATSPLPLWLNPEDVEDVEVEDVEDGEDGKVEGGKVEGGKVEDGKVEDVEDGAPDTVGGSATLEEPIPIYFT